MDDDDDGDGIPDHLDRDDDGDGIPDDQEDSDGDGIPDHLGVFSLLRSMQVHCISEYVYYGPIYICFLESSTIFYPNSKHSVTL